MFNCQHVTQGFSNTIVTKESPMLKLPGIKLIGKKAPNTLKAIINEQRNSASDLGNYMYF